MNNLVRTELLKLRLTPSTWGFLAAALVIAGLRIAMALAAVGTAAGVERGSSLATLTLAGSATFGGLVVLLLGVACATGEVRHCTLTDSVLRVSDRRRLVVAKCIALALVGVVSSLLLVAVGYAIAIATGVGGGVAPSDGAWLIVTAAAGGAFWGWLGVGVGLLIDIQPIALLVPVAWLLVVEPLVAAYGLAAVVPWLPGSLAGQLTTSATGGPSPVVALLTILGYGGLLSVLGTRRLVRRDIA